MAKLIAYLMDGHSVDIRPVPMERAWMGSTDRQFAYCCLPLNIANAHGWEILTPAGFSADWSGFTSREAIRIRTDLGASAPAVSHFGHGVLTFHLPCLFRTDPGIDRLATGPLNRYFRGLGAGGDKGPVEGHRTRLRLQPFADDWRPRKKMSRDKLARALNSCSSQLTATRGPSPR
jgi:hypothetical protein